MSEMSAGSSEDRVARSERALAAVLRWMSAACLAVLLVLVSALVLIRFFPIVSLGWADEIVELFFAWMVFVGTTAVWRSNEHITIDFIPQALVGSRAGRALEVVLSLLALGFLAVFTWQGWLLTIQARGNTSPMLTMPKPLWYAAIPVSGLMMIGYTLSRTLKAVRPSRGDRQGREAR